MALIQQMAHKKMLLPFIMVLLMVVSFGVKAETPTPQETFQKIMQAFNTVDFNGKLMFVSYGPEEGPVREALVIKKAPDKKRIEFIWPEEVKGTGMIVNGKERWPIRKEGDEDRRQGPSRDGNRDGNNRQNFPQRSRRPPPGPPPPDGMMEDFPYKNMTFLLKNYNIRVLNGGHVADRDTYLLELESKISPRPSRKLWIDKEKGVILKLEQYDTQKRLRGFFAYSEINYNSKIDDSVFRGGPPKILGIFRQRDGRGREEIWNNEQGTLDIEKISEEAKMNLSLPKDLSSGFVIESVTVLKFGERRTVHLKYTDGLAIVSVFESPYKDDDRPPGRPEGPQGRRPKSEKVKVNGVDCQIISVGPMLVFRWNLNNISFTLMGEMSRKETTEMVKAFIVK